jgi:hypothetical protein
MSGDAGTVVQVGPWERIDVPMLAAALNAGAIRRVERAGYGQRMENFLPHEIYDQVFVTEEVQEGYASEHLVCPVRAGDIVDGNYGDYPLTPVEFYAQLIDLPTPIDCASGSLTRPFSTLAGRWGISS